METIFLDGGTAHSLSAAPCPSSWRISWLDPDDGIAIGAIGTARSGSSASILVMLANARRGTRRLPGHIALAMVEEGWVPALTATVARNKVWNLVVR